MYHYIARLFGKAEHNRYLHNTSIVDNDSYKYHVWSSDPTS